MLLGPGVQLITHESHMAGVQHVLSVKSLVANIDTYYHHTITNASELLKAVIDSLSIPEWYGYEFPELIVSFLAQPLHISPPTPSAYVASGAAIVSPRLLMVFILRPALHGILKDPQFIWPLIRSHELAKQRGVLINTVIFMEPITNSKSRI